MFAPLLIALSLIIARPAASPDDTALAKQLLKGADARIDHYRKADATIVVLDRKGKPIPNARVKVEQLRHEFLFGCAALSLLKHPDASKEQSYEQQFGDLFNFATVLAYWHETEPQPGKYSLDRLDAEVSRLKAMGLKVKGHPLIIAGSCPTWAPQEPEAVRELTRKRILAMTDHYKGQIDVWDVVGDATTARDAKNGLGAWARKAGPALFTADALRWARTGNPDAVLMYNDYKLDKDYTDLIRQIAKTGAPLNVLGLEAHMMGSEWPLEKVWNTAETFGKLGKPLHFSEITVLSDDPKADHSKDWPSTQEGEKRQADYVEKLYTILFSHPAVRGIAWWNFVDGDWDRYPGGLLRADLTPKPAYDRLVKLIKQTWWTRTDLVADSKGQVKFRGFAGRYLFTVQTATKNAGVEVDVKRGKPNNFKVAAE